MSSPRREMENRSRLRDEVVGEPITAHKYRCNQCPRTAFVECNGVLTVKTHHDNEPHATAIPINALMKDYINRANVETLRMIERIVEARLGLLNTRMKPAGPTRVL